MYCQNCGKQYIKKTNFCSVCGAKQINNEPQSEDKRPEVIIQDNTTPSRPSPAYTSTSKEAEQQKAFKDLYSAVVKELSNGKNPQQITKELNTLGFTNDDALNFVERVQKDIEEYKKSPEAKKVMAEKYRKVMLNGVVWFFGGLIVTGITYSIASANGGGTYLITWGAVIFGAYDFIRGFIGWIKNVNQ